MCRMTGERTEFEPPILLFGDYGLQNCSAGLLDPKRYRFLLGG